MNMVFQLIDLKTGCRSSAMNTTTQVLAETIAKDLKPEALEETGILVLMDQFTGEWDFSKCAFITCQKFVELFRNNSHEQQIFQPTAESAIPLRERPSSGN